MQRVRIAPEPKLHLQRYVLEIHYLPGHKRYVYCLNMKEVKEVKAKQRKGVRIHVFKIDYNFVGGWIA